MTEIEQNIAIAEACGWKWLDVEDGFRFQDGAPSFTKKWVDRNGLESRRLPDYVHDLNAMHEAIMAQPVELRDKINCRLLDIIDKNKPYVLDRAINATAAQRAKAFLRTLNLWKD